MFETLIDLDKNLLVFLNNLGNSSADVFWIYITKQAHWWPFFLLLFFLLFKKLPLKHFLMFLMVVALLILFTDQTTNLVKNSVQRFRPVNDEEIKNSLRLIRESYSWSYFSGHASNSMAVSVFIFFLLKKHYKYLFLIFLFPLIFAYSRIYLALHFPLDILSGYFFGMFSGYIFFKFFCFLQRKFPVKVKVLDS